MGRELDALLAGVLALEDNEGEDKVMPLREAVTRFVKPGSAIHLAATHCCSGAAILEIARQFQGKKPEFTLIMRGIRDTVTILIHLGLVRKVITAFSGNVYPWYSPNPVIQKAYTSGATDLEDWSILTFPLRLMAGAMGCGVMPTSSLVGSTLAERNKDAFTVMDDPFGSGRKIGLLKALNPDISIMHALAVDREGNAILTAPYSEGAWGARASRGGAIVTAERLVSTAFIRKHAHLVKLPAYLVKAVCIVPFGAHPGGVWNAGIESCNAYAEDYAFMTEFNNRCRDPLALDTWIEEWVHGCPTFEDYLEKLGRERLLGLKGQADNDAWRLGASILEERLVSADGANATETMVVLAARLLQERIPLLGLKTMLAGAGTANLAAWVAKYELKKRPYLVELLVELGYFGNSPRPGEPFVLNFGNFPTCKMLTDTLDALGVFTCGATNQCMGVLGGGQIDRFGNLNSHWMSEEVYLTGSGGANDVATAARETTVVMQASPQRFVDRVPFITAPGERIRTLVSPQGVFEKGEGREFVLTRHIAPREGQAPEDVIREIRDRCGWDLKVAARPQVLPGPTEAELSLLRIFDPHGFYLH